MIPGLQERFLAAATSSRYASFKFFSSLSPLQLQDSRVRHRVTAKEVGNKRDAKSSLEYCMTSVKLADYENYLCSLLLPPALRSTAFAIRAFNVELAQIRDIVSDKTIGQMRMQFWKDSLERIYAGSPPGTPVALELAQAVQRGTLSKLWLKRLIEARTESLFDKPFASMEAVERYAENSVTPVFYLLLEAAGVKEVQADHGASHLGKAIGIATVIRSVPYHIRRGQVYLPMDLLMKHNLSAELVSRIARNLEKRPGMPISEEEVIALRDLIFEMASKAHQHLETANSLNRKVASSVKLIYLPAVPCEAFLRRLKQVDFDVYHPKLRQKDGWLPFKLWWKSMRRNIK